MCELGFGLKEVPYHFVHLLVLHSMIFLRVLFRVPKAQGQDTIVLFVGDEDSPIHEPFLFLQDRQYLVIDVARLAGIFRRRAARNHAQVRETRLWISVG